MSSTKKPTTETANTDVTETPEESLSLLERVKQLKSRQNLSHPDPRNAYGGPKVRVDPRGTRRSMGKR